MEKVGLTLVYVAAAGCYVAAGWLAIMLGKAVKAELRKTHDGQGAAEKKAETVEPTPEAEAIPA